MTRVLLRAGSVYAHGVADAEAVIIDDGVIAWVGDRIASAAYETTVEKIVELGDRLITPGFVDAHVHLSSTGSVLTGLDLSNASSAADALSILSNFTFDDSSQIVLGHGWDDSSWPDADEWNRAAVDAIVGDRLVYLSRIDVHSALVSTTLLIASGVISDASDFHTGKVDSDEHHLVRELVIIDMPSSQRQQLIRSALEFAASKGIVCVHENGGPIVSGESDTRDVVALSDEPDLPQIVVYWGDSNLEKMRELGAYGAAGDYFIDGSIGSCTAHINEPYDDASAVGHASANIDAANFGKEYVTRDEVAAHFIACTQQGIQAGFHAIGDAALDSITYGLRQAMSECGVDAVRRARHRIEHAELLTDEHIEVFAEAGVLLSMQPVFDELWAQPGGMYEQRIGQSRTAQLNPFAKLLRTGISLAFGSDSPVTPIDPWRAIRAASQHSHGEHSISVRAAFAAHTRGGWRAAGYDDRGVISVGVPADLAVWNVENLEVRVPDDRVRAWSTDERSGVSGLPSLDSSPECVLTLRNGLPIFDAQGVMTQ